MLVSYLISLVVVDNLVQTLENIQKSFLLPPDWSSLSSYLIWQGENICKMFKINKLNYILFYS